MRLVMRLGCESRPDLEWLRELVAGRSATDRELVEALCRSGSPMLAETLVEARLVALRCYAESLRSGSCAGELPAEE